MLGFLRATSLLTLRRHGRRAISYANPPGSEDLMVPTLKKWLYGDRIRECPFQIANLCSLLFCASESKIRRLDFDVEALKQVATRVTGATCTDIKTTHEGR